ncbi:hypothetical protein CSV63_12680 [Sporosarcina sp. P34]|uniref:hypothetical protein n=1 Tax=Sporosarcina sp. P34 TaxID=2048247 RepID=UPI000C16B35C|nr:hypothetical protein [Sporosarcina sp. P34]PID14378.1 hypothetical protein CSV63_12680 [Sporosarcina sp. P34]
MPVTQYYPIGSITMPSSWIAFMAGFLVTYLFIRLYFGKVHAERIGDLFFYIVIIWKVSVIATDFTMVMKNPLSILYFHGGKFGWILGVVVASVLLLRQVYKQKWKRIDKWSLLLALICWQAVYQIVMTFLNEGNLVVKIATILLFVAVFVLSWWCQQKNVNTVSELAGVLLAVHFLVSAIQGNLVNTAFVTTIFIGLFMWAVEKFSAQPISGKEEVK